MDLYERALKLWGKPLQLNMVIEECAELITSVSQELRGRDSKEFIIEECADVIIMLEQLQYILNIETDVAEMKAFKLERLEKRIKKAEKKIK